MVDPVEREQVAHRGQVGLDAPPLREHERPRLGREREHAAVVLVVERLDAHPVARAEQPVARSVPDREREHAVQVPDAVVTPRPVRGEDHPRVGRAGELEALRLELGAQLHMVVDLAVVDDPALRVGVAHRLVPGRRQVDDRQPPVPERDAVAGGRLRAARLPRRPRQARAEDVRRRVGAAVRERLPAVGIDEHEALVVGPAMPQEVRHRLQPPEVRAPLPVVESGDSAHAVPPFWRWVLQPRAATGRCRSAPRSRHTSLFHASRA